MPHHDDTPAILNLRVLRDHIQTLTAQLLDLTEAAEAIEAKLTDITGRLDRLITDLAVLRPMFATPSPECAKPSSPHNLTVITDP